MPKPLLFAGFGTGDGGREAYMRDNIEEFNMIAADIFGRCYQSFPLPTDISVIDLGDLVRPSDDNDLDMRDDKYKIARASLDWLSKAGYIWHGTATNFDCRAVTLSPKGLEVMNAVPSGVQTNMSVGAQLGQGVKVIGKEAASHIAKTALSYGAKLMLNA